MWILYAHIQAEETVNESIEGDCKSVSIVGQRLRDKLTSIVCDFFRGIPVDHVEVKTLLERGQRVLRFRRKPLYK